LSGAAALSVSPSIKEVNAMKSLIPWNKNRTQVGRANEAVSPIFALQREMDRVFDNFMRDFDHPSRALSSWPSIEVSETSEDIKVVAELPDLDKGDVEVTLHDGVLTLKGEKRLERNGTLYSERWEGSFQRDIPVGKDVDADKVKATFKNGVLTVALSKKPELQREVKRIAIN
jgi:HSP20 family protein